MRRFTAPEWVKALICTLIRHDWRSDTTSKKHCARCGVKYKRAVYDWDEWVKDDYQ
jgi:hypothetical protein